MAAQIQHVQTSPGIRDPRAVLITNILQNRERPQPPPDPPPLTRASFAARRGPLAGEKKGEGGSSSRDDAPRPPPALDPAHLAYWQQVLAMARAGLPAADYARALRYAQLLDLDLAQGWALVGLPTEYLAHQVEQQFGAYLADVLTQVCRRPIQVAAVMLPGQGPLAAPLPTLAGVLAARGVLSPASGDATAPQAAQDGRSAAPAPAGGSLSALSAPAPADALTTSDPTVPTTEPVAPAAPQPGRPSR